MTGNAALTFSTKGTDRFMFMQEGTSLFGMALITIGITAMGEVQVVFPGEIMTTHTSQSLIGNGVIGSLAKIIYNRNMASTTETPLFIN
jgi:hypothetical protein